VGVSQDGNYLYILAADGRSAQSAGITDLQAGQLLLQLGAYNGLNLDGGGSTTLAQSNGAGGASVLNIPSGGSQRLVGNSLAIFAKPLVTNSIPTNGTYSQAVINNNPALYYQLTETSGTTANDSSGNGINGTYPGAGITKGQTSSPITSQANTTILGSGTTGSHITVPYNAAMSAGSFTIAAWANPTSSTGTAFEAVVSERDDKGSGPAGNNGFTLYDGPADSATGTRWQFWLGGTSAQTYSFEGRNRGGLGLGPVATAGQWAFVVGTFQATSGPDGTGRYTGIQDLYVNGVLQLSLSGVSYLPDTTTPMYIGAGANESTPADNFDFSGDISQVALFDSALSQNQIQSMYTAATAAPEPGSFGLLTMAACGLIGFRHRRKHS
jgi:hypothetical protein